MSKLKTWIASAALLSLAITSVAFATPSISSPENQSFDENQAVEQLRNVTITESSDEPVITAGEIRLTLPADVDIIFDDERSDLDIVIYGSAVDSGKVLESPELNWENGDKTVVIPVLSAFEADEYIVVTKLYVEGFNSSSLSSDEMTMTVSGSEEVYTDLYYLDVNSSSTNDTAKPEAPSDIVLTNTSEGVEITWADPTDLDLQTVEILRGLNGVPPSGTSYGAAGDGEEYFLDDELDEGDEVSYILRSNDGRNYSDNSEEYSITYMIPVEEEIIEEEIIEEEIIEEEETVEEIVEEEILEEEVVEEEEVLEEEQDLEAEPPLFDDVLGHWGEAYIESLYVAGVVSGNDDGTFGPDKYLNRAELAKMLVLAYTDGLIEGVENPYDDVSEDDWYVDYAASANSYGIMTGEADGSFNGAANVNRATLMQAVYNAAGLSETGKDLPFTDVMESDWFYNAVDAGYWLSIVNGEDEDTFNPSGLATRAAAAKVIYNGWYAGPLVFED